jgi:hypothetical protein
MFMRIKLFLAAAGAFLLMVLTTWLSLKRAADANEKAKVATGRIEAMKQAEEIENEVEALSVDDLKRRSAKWVRNNGQ